MLKQTALRKNGMMRDLRPGYTMMRNLAHTKKGTTRAKKFAEASREWQKRALRCDFSLYLILLKIRDLSSKVKQ